MKTWRERVAEARARGKFADQDVRDVGGWGRCAVGEHAAALPGLIRFVSGNCADADLDTLGMAFMLAVDSNNFDRADSLLDAIDDRVLTLKRAAPTPPCAR